MKLKIQPGTAYLTAFHLVDKDAETLFVEVNSMRAPAGRSFPPDAIVLPYGGKAREKTAAQFASLAQDGNKEIHQIEVGVDIDRLSTRPLTLASLRTTSMMNITRLDKCVEATILDYWCDYLEEEGKDLEWITTHLGRNVQACVSSRPDLLGRLSLEREFRHLNMIVFSLHTQDDSVDVGMILHRHAITQTRCKTAPDLTVLLSKDNTDRAGV